jgi:putative ABC transport system permease protein
MNMNSLWLDFRHALRQLRQRPGFAAVTIFTLALGIGATTAIFSVVYGVLLRPLPYPQPDRIVQLSELDATGGSMHVAEPNFLDLRSGSKSFAGLAQVNSDVATVTGAAEPTRANASAVSQDFFKVLGVMPVVGRAFSSEDQRASAAPVMLVSHAFWQQYLGSSPDLSQFKLVADGRIYSVVGVMPEHFSFPDNTALWVPRELFPKDESRTAHNWTVYGRLGSGASLASARSEVDTIARRLKQQYGVDTDMSGAAVVRLQDATTAQVRPALFLLLGAVAFLLLVACANVANLLLAQAAARQRELAIRSALGANRGALVQQFLVESLVLCGISGALGIIAGRWGLDILVALAPQDLPRLDTVSTNLPVLSFAVAVILLLAAGLGIFTAVRASAGDVREALGEGGQGQIAGPRSQRLARVVVVAQMATTLVLLVGAGLLGRSLLRVLNVDPGFHTEHVVTMDLAFPQIESDAEKIRRVRFVDELFARLRTLPGVDAVGGSDNLPLASDFLANGTFWMVQPGQEPKTLEDFQALGRNKEISGYADYSVASDDYLKVLGIPLVRGRMFDGRDTMDATHVAVINEALARERWPHEDPLGKTVEFGNMDNDTRLLTIVGIVGDARNRSLERRAAPTIYVDFRQRPQRSNIFTVVMRSAMPPAGTISASRDIMHTLDPDLPPHFHTFQQVFASSLAGRKFNLTLVSAFAVTALLLAAAGIYGVMAYTVARRTRELGVRMALGATPADVLRLVLGQGMWTTALGAAIGMAGTFALTRLISSLLFGVSPFDPLTLGGVVLVLAAVSLLACWLPARKATRVDPLAALRYE